MDTLAKGIGYVFIFLVFIGVLRQCDKQADEEKAKPPATPAAVTFLDQETYVASETVRRFEFTVREPSAVQLVLDIKNATPLDVVIANGQMSDGEYLAAAMLVKPLTDTMDMLSDQPSKPVDFFSSPLARQGAYQRFESPFARFEAGVYTVILDNTPAFTPSRGDAPVRLRLMSRPIAQPQP